MWEGNPAQQIGFTKQCFWLGRHRRAASGRLYRGLLLLLGRKWSIAAREKNVDAFRSARPWHPSLGRAKCFMCFARAARCHFRAWREWFERLGPKSQEHHMAFTVSCVPYSEHHVAFTVLCVPYSLDSGSAVRSRHTIPTRLHLRVLVVEPGEKGRLARDGVSR